MNIQPIDLPSLLRAFLWPALAIIVFVVYRHSLRKLIITLAQRAHKFSFGVFSLELAQVSEIKPLALETEIRNLEAGLFPQSGSSGISSILMQLRQDRQHDYMVIDLGPPPPQQWITSRLYILALLITLIDRPLCFVFVETVGDIRKRFIGAAGADRVRWALARRYTWLESASANAYASLGDLQFDPTTGTLSDSQITEMMKTFLDSIRWNSPVPIEANAGNTTAPANVAIPTTPSPVINTQDWVYLNDGVQEHAKYVDGARIERLLGDDLTRSRVTLPPDKLINDLTRVVLGQPGRFVAVVDPDLAFRELVDRYAILESLAYEFLKQTAPSSTTESGEDV
jgi:hypothetical protein